MNKWWKDAVGYQIYPRSFKDTTGDGLGDLNGVREKIPYLKDLGVDFVWLTPFYESPDVDNGYDISNYQALSKDVGTMADFQELVKEAKQADIKIILDLVINHTSDQHEWFQKSREGHEDYKDFYIWHAPVDGKEPNDWQSIFGGSVWEFDEGRGEYYFHAFAKEQPDLNWDNPVMKQKIFEMIEWWAQQGIDGFRIDAISHIKKDAWNKPAEATSVAKNYMNVEGIDEYLNELSDVLRKNNLMSVGEASGVTSEEATTWVGDDGYFDMIFEFEHIHLWNSGTEGSFDIVSFKEALIRWQEAVADDKGWNALYMENHDVPRSISVFGDDSEEFREISGKALATAFMLLQGTPFIYQGQEIGMINNQFDSIEDVDAVDSRNLYKRLLADEMSSDEAIRIVSNTTRDNARTPMQWDDSQFAGFSSSKPWLMVNENNTWLNVVAEQKNEASIYHFYKQLIALRKEYPVFIDGRFKSIETPDSVFAYTREDASDSFTIIVNLGDTVQEVAQLSDLAEQTLVLSNYSEQQAALQPFEARVYKK